jgi:hypothetical protein
MHDQEVGHRRLNQRERQSESHILRRRSQSRHPHADVRELRSAARALAINGSGAAANQLSKPVAAPGK